MQPGIFIFPTPNVSLEDEHLLHISKYRNTRVQSHKPLLSHFIGRESRKGDRVSDSYISNTYIQHITLITWHLQYIVIKDLSWRKNFSVGMLFFLDFFFFCHRRIIVIVSAFVLFIIINIIVLLVGWRLVVTRLRLWLVVLALLWTEKWRLELKMLWSHRILQEKTDVMCYCTGLLHSNGDFPSRLSALLLVQRLSLAGRGQHQIPPVKGTSWAHSSMAATPTHAHYAHDCK